VQHSFGRVQRSSEGIVKLNWYRSALACYEARPGSNLDAAPHGVFSGRAYRRDEGNRAMSIGYW
jgi:hypothetical protein